MGWLPTQAAKKTTPRGWGTTSDSLDMIDKGGSRTSIPS